jgi:FkbM family methyltransferase
MRLRDGVPDCARIFLKRAAYRLYLLSERFFRGPFDKYDFQTIYILRRHLKANSNCIDVGANLGHILREIITAAPNGQHMAFEPIPSLFKHLTRKYGRRVQVFNYALSDNEGQADFFYYQDSPALSGFRDRKRLGRHHVLKLKVETKPLDKLVPHRVIDLIKIDVEGAELAVLQGSIETLKRSKPIVLFETGLGGADEYATTPEQLFDLLSDCGLSVSLMEYFLKGKKPFTREEFCGQFYKHYNYFYIAYDATIF